MNGALYLMIQNILNKRINMKVKELIKELIECDLETEVKIKLIASTMPDGKDYISGVDIHGIDLNESEILKYILYFMK